MAVIDMIMSDCDIDVGRDCDCDEVGCDYDYGCDVAAASDCGVANGYDVVSGCATCKNE